MNFVFHTSLNHQVENFGMHLRVDGTIVYGVYVEAVLDNQADHISLDHLSRLLVDVHQVKFALMIPNRHQNPKRKSVARFLIVHLVCFPCGLGFVPNNE